MFKMALILWVDLDSMLGKDEAQQFAGWNPKDALLRVKHHVVFPEIIKGFF